MVRLLRYVETEQLESSHANLELEKRKEMLTLVVEQCYGHRTSRPSSLEFREGW